MNSNWLISQSDRKIAQELAEQLKISPLTAQVLINRGIQTLEQAAAFLNPRLKHLRDPLEIPNIVNAAKRVLLAKEKGEKVAVYGDYDVDGVTGTVILLKILKFLGISAGYYIPHRYGEGYSLSVNAVQKLAQDGYKLIITVDCGVASFDEIAAANELGLEVVVTDHHNLPENLPPAYAIVNPKQIVADHPSKYLSGSGVAFKFAWALLKIAGIKDIEFLTALLDLAALGTFSDVVPLTGENRVIAINGLKILNQGKRLGLTALATAAGLKGNISENNIYFALAPRLNAAGRIEHASKAVELLASDDQEQVNLLARELNQINSRRQGIGDGIKEAVFSQIQALDLDKTKVIVLSGPDWHPGVIGIVASRVVDHYARPTILIGINDGVGRGSARSIEGVNIFELLNSCRDLFLDFGGHEGAAGFEISVDKIPELTKRLQDKAEQLIALDTLKPKIIIDAELEPALMTLGLARELKILSPFGEGNEPPVFMTREVKLISHRLVGQTGKHLKARFAKDNITLEAIGFGLGDVASKLEYNKNYDLAYQLEANEWDGFETVQLSLVDVREAQA